MPSRHVTLLGWELDTEWCRAGQGARALASWIYCAFVDYLEPGAMGNLANSQRRVLPNRGKAEGSCYSGSGQEGRITSQ